MSAHILLAEDDGDIRRGLVATLESEGYEVTAVANGAQAMGLLKQETFDLVMLDVMMPKLSGFDVCRELRSAGIDSPVLFLTAKGEEVDKVVGLKLGADDYVTKPFGVHELLARVEALLRRSRPAEAEPETMKLPDQLKIGNTTVDRRNYRLIAGENGQPLTRREMRVLEILALHSGEVVSRDDLLNGAWGVDYYGTTRTLDQHIAQLRKKIEPQPDKPVHILTVHGVGYRLENE
ncbi:MAG: response regulator transcription factor [Opitutaceae bacterium]|jgi:DNA-binding response OmpR family regulator|nr:response regulator transcription factor [Opitutaceae bacterium]